jgi:hypothetical protein
MHGMVACNLSAVVEVRQQDFESLMAFLQALNSTLPNIRLTWQISQTSIDYMDITISKCMDTAGPTVGFLSFGLLCLLHSRKQG